MVKRNKGITLVALVVTIIILLILAGITIAQLTGNGLFSRTQTAANENNKQTATEKINLKITNLQMASYIETKQMPSLQYVADGLCEDEEMEYVLTASKSTAALDKIQVGEANSIFTKLKQYPYEFEINSSLQLASINGVKVSSNDSSSYDELKASIDEMKGTIAELQDNLNEKQEIIEKLQTDNESLKTRINTLENKTLTNGNFKTLWNAGLTYSAGTSWTSVQKEIQLNDSIENYDFIIIVGRGNATDKSGAGTYIYAVDDIVYNNSQERKSDGSQLLMVLSRTAYEATTEMWLRNDKTLYINRAIFPTGTVSCEIVKVYGVKI